MKVLLISANKLVSPYPVYPMGLDYVAGALSRHRVKIVDMNLHSHDSLISVIEQFQPDVVGISMRNIDNNDAVSPYGFIKDYKNLVDTVRNHTRATLVVGGTGFSIFPEQILAALPVDYGIVGEGERMADLLDALEKGAAVDTLPGVVTPSSPFEFPSPLEASPARRFDPGKAHVSFYLKKGGMLNLQTKRGCPLRCIYCTYPHIEGRRLRLIPPETVAATARDLQDAGARYLFIADSAFNVDTDHSLAVAEAFKAAGLTIPWGAFLAPMKMPDHYYDALKSAGLTHAEFGTESLSDPVLSAYGKPFDREQVMISHEAATRAGLHVAHYLLLGGPGETSETLDDTLTYAEKLKKTVLFIFCGMRIYPYTDLYKRALAEGKIDASQDLLEPIFYESSDITNDEIIQRVKQKAGGRINWIIGAGEEDTTRVLSRMYKRGRTGPLWEYLIR
jgi:radical SAM superfamily enzyme YgiQ (UPF0313 family)